MIDGVLRDEAVLVVARIAGRALAIIGMAPIDDIAQRIVEIDLADEKFLAFDKDAAVNMRRAALVPSGIDRQKACLPDRIRQLAAAKGKPAYRLRIIERAHVRSFSARVDAAVIGMPDFDICVFDRSAIGCMDNADGQPQGQPRLSLGDVLAGRDVVDMAGAKGLGDGRDAIRARPEERRGQLFQGDRPCAATEEISALPVECPGGHDDMSPRPECGRSDR